MPRRGTKRERHLAHFKETGQMTPWLEKRLTWDKKMAKELLDEMFGRSNMWLDYDYIKALNVHESTLRFSCERAVREAISVLQTICRGHRMSEQDNQPDGFKTEHDEFQLLLERCYRTLHLPQREAVDADLQTGMCGDE